ncbi:hypothetical protein BKP35_18295 [Anaerobacillus arseniciselenatis]|uniref:Uncharacterized protein n=1 Tax=Anaerobacillus arseniciselenatis TaxID=85682 RepID=A0A1S2L792_9BACI|nr:hypothetical protein [Anaerobacillus arseniciselenatis]OIJ07637.1 hypothetical protein BKP35_18295 [Anaerobacillus arseniciselenatis]
MEIKFFTIKGEKWFFEKTPACEIPDYQCEAVFKKLEEHIRSVNFHYERNGSDELIQRNFRIFSDITSILVSVGLYINPIEHLEGNTDE